MKKATMTFLLILSLMGSAVAQDSLFILHPVIGDIIDRYEKNNFNLFPEVSGSRFEYSYIKQDGNQYWLKSHLFPDSLVIRQLDTSEIRQLINHVNVMIATNPALTKTGKQDPGEEAKSVVVKTNEASQTSNTIIYPNDIESISDEATTNQRLKEDAERRNHVEQGTSIEGDGLYIDFSKRKKKK
jgi:hypothetical protein